MFPGLTLSLWDAWNYIKKKMLSVLLLFLPFISLNFFFHFFKDFFPLMTFDALIHRVLFCSFFIPNIHFTFKCSFILCTLCMFFVVFFMLMYVSIVFCIYCYYFSLRLFLGYDQPEWRSVREIPDWSSRMRLKTTFLNRAKDSPCRNI